MKKTPKWARCGLNGRIAAAGVGGSMAAAWVTLVSPLPLPLSLVLAGITGAAIQVALLSSATRRIRRVAAAARRGVFDRRTYRPLADETGDEIGVVARAFDRLVSGTWCLDVPIPTPAGDREELERQVSLRTRQLMEEIDARKAVQARLEAARDLAEEANVAKSSFLANMSHEIRTPLNGLIGMAELLTTTRLDSVQTRYCANIQACSRALLDLINDVLDLSKIEAGKMELATCCFDLRAEVDHVIGVLSQRAAVKALELSHRIDPGIPNVLRSDPTRIRQVLMNLVGNAIKFTDEGSVTVWVSLLSELDGAVKVHFSIRDTGPGLDPAVTDTIFEAFSQADASTTRQHGGTGLGLAISKRIVEMLGGEIGVESVPGRGSHFWFTCSLPVAPAELTAGSGPRLDLGDLRIVTCVSDSRNRHIVAEQLTHRGATSIDVSDCDSARAVLESCALSEEAVAIVIVDSDVGESAADELFEWMAGDERLEGTWRIAIADPDQVEYYKGAMIARADATLIKPVRVTELLGAIRARTTDEDEPYAETFPAARAPVDARVLVVEDNDVNQEIVQALLNEAGFQVDVAWDGVEAVSILERRGYDAILMDCQMPRMDGFEATREIRAREAGHRTPIIALTANAIRGDRERCLAAGMDDYLSKPLDPRRLVETIVRWVTTTGDGPGEPRAVALSASTTSDAAPGIDWPILLQRCGGKEERARSVLARFDAKLGREIADLEAAFAGYDEDREAFVAVAHRIKGAAAMLGAGDFASLLQAIELAGRQAADRDAVADLMTRLPGEVARVHEASQALTSAPGVDA